MKKVLFATTALVMTAGVAAAEVTLSGDARMGITSNNSLNEFAFTSRARVTFTMSGTTDGGLEFGASFRADNAAANTDTDLDGDHDTGGAVNGQAGEVYISGAFGRLAMGDVDGAAQAAVGQVDGVGLTGLGDYNEISYLLGSVDPSMLYSYTAGQISFYLSAEQPLGGNEAWGAGVKWATDAYSLSLGYEDDNGATHAVIGGSATFSGVTLKAIYGDSSDALADGDQYAVSVSGTFSGVGVTAFYNEDGAGDDAYGLGASYDLGGGASLVGGVVAGDQVDVDGDGADDVIADFGVSFTF